MSQYSATDLEEEISLLDTEYREALARAMMKVFNLPGSPLMIKIRGTAAEQQLLRHAYHDPLSDEKMKEILALMDESMKNDYQYGDYVNIRARFLPRESSED